MYPILDRYGPFFLYAYTVVLGCGVLAALSLTGWLARRDTMSGWIDGVVLAGMAALIGGRAGYVLAHLSYFGEHPAEIWLIGNGGISYLGALLFGLGALWLWSKWRQVSFSHLLELLAPGVALLSATGWAACWLEGCGYGRETAPGLLAASLPDEYGVFAIRYQTQLIGALLSLAVAVLLLAMWRRGGFGVLFCVALLGVSLSHGLVSALRGDFVPLLLNQRLDVLLDVGVAALAVFCIARHDRTARRSSER